MRMSKKIHPGQLSLPLEVKAKTPPPACAPFPPKGGKEKHTFTERMLTATLQEVRALRKELKGRLA